MYPIEVEKKLKRVWLGILEIESVDHSTSYYKCGGDSLSVMLLITRIEEEFGIIVSLGDLHENQTIHAQVNLILKLLSNPREKTIDSFMPKI
ncbi:acyl carrier protein [Paenibacillus periandrae]|uniref:acyl carrier protein n=1 Tax=Paenibacillus periandrae TaxID=1761741 RepID=UPI001F095413|nr:acyl carrier protein [Paenibacillus periandrae]